MIGRLIGGETELSNSMIVIDGQTDRMEYSTVKQSGNRCWAESQEQIQLSNNRVSIGGQTGRRRKNYVK